MTRRNPKKEDKSRAAQEESDTESNQTPSVELPQVQEQPIIEEDKVDPIVEEKKKYLKMYARARGEFRAYLPSWNSELGQCKEFLKGIVDKKISFPKRRQVYDVKLNYAPGDAVLFEMLKQAKHAAFSHSKLSKLDLGYQLGAMPDTQYMINMIFFFDPTNIL